MSKKTAALILAAGQGKRMRSRLPKVLHPCAEAPLVTHVVKLALGRKCNPIVVVVDAHGGTRVREVLTATFPEAPLQFVVQQVPRGTGDAVRTGLAAIPRFSGRVLILYGDVPLLTGSTVGKLQRALTGKSLAFLTAEVDDPAGYGRVIRNGTRATEVIEHRDATRGQRAIREINVGVYLCDAALLKKSLSGVGSNNAQGEFYLTDVVALAAKRDGAAAVRVADIDEVRGVNTRAELAAAEHVMRRRLISAHQARGVTFRDPDGTFIGSAVEIGRDAVIGVGVQLSGRVKIASGAHVEGPTVIKDAEIGRDAVIHAFSHVEGAKVARGASVGPFGRLRPGAVLDEGAKIGNFVEMKKARLGKGAKANHLAYLGDAEIGGAVNIGAGTITCNYDGGPVKHKTVIGDGAFTGSNSTLVAPITIGKGAYVAAGSTVNKNIPKDALAFGRSRQVNREGYARILRRRTGTKGKT
jgi:bifunctional UDP-N-acetylglucosamine pyrophosphorylase/glucosamine-1-phosphate N-acetyltransferase